MKFNLVVQPVQDRVADHIDNGHRGIRPDSLLGMDNQQDPGCTAGYRHSDIVSY